MEPEQATEREEPAGAEAQPVTVVTRKETAEQKARQVMDDAAASARRLMDRMRGSLDRVEERVEQRGEHLLRIARKQPALAVGAAAAGGLGLALVIGPGQLIAAFGAGYLAHRALRGRGKQSGETEQNAA